MPYSLIFGHTKSCGCLKTSRLKTANTKFVVGSKIGMMTIIKDYESYNKHGKKQFQIKCDCGVIKDIYIQYGAKSCGCLKRRCKDPEGLEYKRFIYTSKKRKLDCLISESEFLNLIFGNCYYCGDAPSTTTLRYSKKNRNGIDRVNNDIGYETNNCVSCCANCNMAKRQLTKEQFLELIRKIYTNHISNAL
jgi:hypothetical protein